MNDVATPIVSRDPEAPIMVRPTGIIWREHHVLSSASRLIIAAIEQVCRER